MRRADEFEASRVHGTVNVPLHELLMRMDQVPLGRLWVHIDAMFADAASVGVPLES